MLKGSLFSSLEQSLVKCAGRLQGIVSLRNLRPESQEGQTKKA